MGKTSIQILYEYVREYESISIFQLSLTFLSFFRQVMSKFDSIITAGYYNQIVFIYTL